MVWSRRLPLTPTFGFQRFFELVYACVSFLTCENWNNLKLTRKICIWFIACEMILPIFSLCIQFGCYFSTCFLKSLSYVYKGGRKKWTYLLVYDHYDPVVFSEILGCGVLEMSLTKQLLPVAWYCSFVLNQRISQENISNWKGRRKDRWVQLPTPCRTT